MSTRVFVSNIINAPIEAVWAQLRDFTFPVKMFPNTITHAEMEGHVNPRTIDGVRKMTWKSGETHRHRLLAQSDLDHSMSWELLPNEHGGDVVVSSVNAVMTTIQLIRITENNTTVVTWRTEFSADVTGQRIKEEQHDASKNLAEIREWFEKQCA